MITSIEHGAIRELRLNRPPANALSAELMQGLRGAIDAAPTAGVRGLVISGSPGMFSGGLDVPHLLTLGQSGIADAWRELYAMMRAIACSSIPIVAAITGHAPAGGTVISLFCDWRVVAEGKWKLGLNEVQVGIPLPPVLLAGLRRLVGPRVADQMAARGSLVSPEQALVCGLVDEITPAEQVVSRAVEWCKEGLSLPPVAMLTTRREARSDMVAIFEKDLSTELEDVIAKWWSEETQGVLGSLARRLKAGAR